ncbi:MAG: lipopolysaccharide heptosyltransferase II [Pseudomonadota bacterium]|nr:lipopolysaccharide heptosyltransferase II [Pseudomonadota bacterium]
MNILIIKLSAIGDVVHTLPALAALRRLYPRAHITWVIEAAAADLISGHPCLDQVLVSHRKRWQEELRSGKIAKAIREIRRFLRELRSRRYDLVVDFHGLFKSAVLTGMSRGVRKLGYDSLQEGSGLFYNERIPEDMSKHAVDRYLDFPAYLAGQAGEAPIGPPEFFIPGDERRRQGTTALLAENGLDGEAPFVAINPVALWPTKLWRADLFAALAERIVRELDLSVVITGSRQEQGYVAAIVRDLKTRRAIDLAGQTSLRDLACLYRRASLVVTTDSGPMHIAAAVGTPVVALFGPTDPRRTGPYGPGHAVIRRELPCSPCFRKTCPTRECMEGIGVDEVWEAVREKLTA